MRLRAKVRQNHLMACVELLNTDGCSARGRSASSLPIRPEDWHDPTPEGQAMSQGRGKVFLLRFLWHSWKVFPRDVGLQHFRNTGTKWFRGNSAWRRVQKYRCVKRSSLLTKIHCALLWCPQRFCLKRDHTAKCSSKMDKIVLQVSSPCSQNHLHWLPLYCQLQHRI